MRLSSLQIRFPAAQIEVGRSIYIQGNSYTLGEAMPQTLGRSALPIGVIMNGYTRQHELLRDGKAVGAAWFYFYGAIEGRRWAVLDEAQLPFEEGSHAA